MVSDATLNRFFLPRDRRAAGAAWPGGGAYHRASRSGLEQPDGVEIKAKKDENGIPLDGIPFHPYYSVHDLLGVGGFLMVFSAVIFFFPEVGGYFRNRTTSSVPIR